MQFAKWESLYLVSVVLCMTTYQANGARILGIFSHFGKSHFDFFEALLKHLAQRGHEVVVISHFPQKTPLANYTDISVKDAMPSIFLSTSLLTPATAPLIKRFGNGPSLSVFGGLMCANVLPLPQVQQILTSDEKFDLVITELFNADCMLSIVHKIQAPHIAMSSCALLPHHHERFGNPDNPSYLPLVAEPATVDMTFLQRFFNTLHYIYYNYFVVWFFYLPSTYYAKKYSGYSVPPLTEIAHNTSLILLNTHFTINRPRPFVPAVIEVAGMHISPVKKLPKNIQEFLDGAEHGAIYFSLGSLFKGDSLENSTRQAFIDAFAELPQRVLWKWDDENIPGKPSNVMLLKWVPQFDVLNHRNVKLYIGHGGQLGTIEAVHCAVPLITIPMFGDQDTTAAHMEAVGMSITLDYYRITKDYLLNAIRKIFTDPSYAENAQKVSRAFHDRPMSPMDTAVYWTEYVIRHKGAHHLRSAAVDMNIFQYLLLDVLAVLLAIIGSLIYITYIACRKILGVFKRKKPVPNKKSNKKKTN